MIQIIDENKGERQSDVIQVRPIDDNPNIRDWRSMQNRKTRSTPVQETIKERRMEALGEEMDVIGTKKVIYQLANSC